MYSDPFRAKDSIHPASRLPKLFRPPNGLYPIVAGLLTQLLWLLWADSAARNPASTALVTKLFLKVTEAKIRINVSKPVTYTDICGS